MPVGPSRAHSIQQFRQWQLHFLSAFWWHRAGEGGTWTQYSLWPSFQCAFWHARLQYHFIWHRAHFISFACSSDAWQDAQCRMNLPVTSGGCATQATQLPCVTSASPAPLRCAVKSCP